MNPSAPRERRPPEPRRRARAGSPARPSPATAGFTLIEIVVVVSILSLVLVLAWPRISAQREGVRSGATELQTNLLKAQRTAVLNQHDVRVIFEPDLRRLVLHLDQNNDGQMQDGEPRQAFALPDAVDFGRTDVPALHWGGDAISFPQSVVTFHRDGSASAEGGVYLSSRRQLLGGSWPDETRAVEVVRATGTVRCRAYSNDGWREGC